ncbi:MAG: hypothetical protein JST80_13395 [Bdellovibrionales bacterium]|nr:hypothetical protein [Bdellovibrionales bacterium]
MSRWRVAQQIIASIKKGEFILKRHAEERIAQRRFSKFDVIEIAKTVIRWNGRKIRKPIFSSELIWMAMGPVLRPPEAVMELM